MTAGPVRRGLTREQLAARVADDLQDGWYVNLGVGLPLRVTEHLRPELEVLLHSEQGLLGIGPVAQPGQENPDLTDAGKNFVTLNPGAAAFDSTTSFAIVRGGHLDVTVLGALQVAVNGDLANWLVPGKAPGVGGAMDLVEGARRVWVVMDHVDKQGRPKIVQACTYPLTGAACVSRIYTSLGVFDRTDDGLVLRECAPGVRLEDIDRLTAAPFAVDLDRDAIPHTKE